MNPIDINGVTGLASSLRQNPGKFTQNLSMMPPSLESATNCSQVRPSLSKKISLALGIIHMPSSDDSAFTKMKTYSICAWSLYFPLIMYAIPPGHGKNIPMQHETIRISMCTLAEQKPRVERFLRFSEKQSFPTPAGGRHLCAVQSSYGKPAILNIDNRRDKRK